MSNNNYRKYETHYTNIPFTLYQMALEDLEYTRNGIDISPRNTVTDCQKFLEMILKYYMELRWDDQITLSTKLKNKIKNEINGNYNKLNDYYRALFYCHNLDLLMDSVDIVGLKDYDIFLTDLSKAYTISKYSNIPSYIYTKQHAREIFDECETIFNIVKQNIDYFETNNHSTQGLTIKEYTVNSIFINTINNKRNKSITHINSDQYIENTPYHFVTEDDLITHKTTENDTTSVNQPKPPQLNNLNFGSNKPHQK